jgi:hypothetical protein
MASSTRSSSRRPSRSGSISDYELTCYQPEYMDLKALPSYGNHHTERVMKARSLSGKGSAASSTRSSSRRPSRSGSISLLERVTLGVGPFIMMMMMRRMMVMMMRTRPRSTDSSTRSYSRRPSR